MALSRRAQKHADEIRAHDWSDAPFRADRAGHKREDDSRSSADSPQLTDTQTGVLKLNIVWVTGQVLASDDPNFDIYEFAEACGVATSTSRGQKNRGIEYGLRVIKGRPCVPGTWHTDEVFAPIQVQIAGRDVTEVNQAVRERGGDSVTVGWGNHYSSIIFYMPDDADAALECRELIDEWDQGS